MTFPKRLLVEGEELILDLRPHWIALAGPAIATVGGMILAFFADSKIKNNGGSKAVWIIYLLVLLIYVVPKTIKWGTEHFVVTSDRLIRRQGLVAKHSMEIPLEHINDVRFEQNVLERIIGAGTLVVQSASEQGRESFDDIRHPEEVQKTIYRTGEQNKQRMYQGGGGQTASAPSTTTELQRLAELRDRGVLTQEEFEAQKAKILGT